MLTLLDQLVALVRSQPENSTPLLLMVSDFLLLASSRTWGSKIAHVPYRDIMQAPNDLASPGESKSGTLAGAAAAGAWG